MTYTVMTPRSREDAASIEETGSGQVFRLYFDKHIEALEYAMKCHKEDGYPSSIQTGRV